MKPVTLKRIIPLIPAVCAAGWVLLLCVAPIVVRAAGGLDHVCGRWTVASGESRMEIYTAGDGSIEGRICWLRDPVYPVGDIEAGKPLRDRVNPDSSLTNRPLLGLVIMRGFKSDGPNRWAGGTVYDPENGKTYKGKMRLNDDGRTLDMRGYVGISLFGRTEKWTRHVGPE